MILRQKGVHVAIAGLLAFAFLAFPGRAQEFENYLLIAASECTNVQCTSSSQANPRIGFFSSVVIEAGENISGQSLADAMGMWNNCSQGGGRSPSFSTTPPADGSTPYRIQVTYQELNAAGDGNCGTRAGNRITVYSFTEVGGQPFSCGELELTLAHELGHWLGLSDSPNCSECQNNMMTWLYSNGSNLRNRSVQSAECSQVNENWKMRGEPGGPDPENPIGRLRGLCELVPELCRDPVTGGFGSEPWWIASDTTPTLECVTVTSYFVYPNVADQSTHCSYQFAPVLQGRPLNLDDFAVYGPTLGLDSTAGPVANTWSASGWASHNPAGVARIAFWIDEAPTSLTPNYGQPRSVDCAGDPNCPNVGFSVVIDTRNLANGPHVLTAVAVESSAFQPGPSRADLQFTVANCLDAIAPTVTLVAPEAGTAISGTTNLQAVATDDVGVVGVDFYVDNGRIGSDATLPYAMNWNSSSIPAGTHVLKARAFDACGNLGTSKPVSVTVLPDGGPPSTTLTQPVPGSLVRGTIVMQAAAFDDVGVAEVKFYVDGAVVATDSKAPFSVSWNTLTVAAGTHSLVAKATDVAGNVGQSSSVAVIVDNTAPGGYIDSPGGGVTVGGTAVPISGWATDQNRVVTLAFQLDGHALALIDPYTYGLPRGDVCAAVPVGDPGCPGVGWRAYFNSTQFSDGSHTLIVTATDGAGNTFSFQRVFLINNDNGAPSVAFTFPGNGALVRGNIPVQVTATDNVAVTKVELYLDGALLVTDASPPYSFSWNTATASEGVHTLTAKAYDNFPNVGIATRSVTVDNIHPQVRIVCEDGTPILISTQYLMPSPLVGMSVSRLFTVFNDGNEALVLANPSALVAGTGFSQIGTAPPATIAPGSSGTFRIRLLAASAGTYYGTASLQTNEIGATPFAFTLKGVVSAVTPKLQVYKAFDSAPVPQGASVSVGSTAVNTTTSLRFRIDNTGNGNLNLANPTTLVNGAKFFQIETPVGLIAPGASAYFRVRLLSATAGSFSGTVSIQSDDPDDNPYLFSVTGSVN